MVKGCYVIYGYDENFMVEEQIAMDLASILKSIASISKNNRVTALTIQPFGEEPMKSPDSKCLTGNISNLIYQLKEIQKELSKICNAICMK